MRKFTACTLPALLGLSLSASIQGFAADSSTQTSHPETVFRFHIPNEPHTLDPSQFTSTDASYFANSIMRGLYSYTNAEGLEPEGAKECVFQTPLKLVCTLAKTSLWSDGTRVKAQDYERAFLRLLNPKAKNLSADFLRNIKGAMAYHLGQKPESEVAIRAKSEEQLVFEFEKPDPDFLFKLTASVFVPARANEYPAPEKSADLVVNGPYKISSWQKGKRIHLAPNPHYHTPGGLEQKDRPDVEVLFIDDDLTALSLYEEGTLSFLRRLPAQLIPKYRTRPDYFESPNARFDYIGFGTELKDEPDFRAALSHAADFPEVTKLMSTVGTFGCSALPERLLDRAHCLKFDLEAAKKHWAKVPESLKKKRWKFFFSKLGGDDVKRQAEWFQAQWKKNLGLEIDLESWDQAAYIDRLRTAPPPLFRKGVGLERPTCLAALETFSRGGGENYLKLEDEGLEKVIERLNRAIRPGSLKDLSHPSTEVRKLCGEGIEQLLAGNRLIPLGRFNFAQLARPQFSGWSLNESNQLDLSRLKPQK